MLVVFVKLRVVLLNVRLVVVERVFVSAVLVVVEVSLVRLVVESVIDVDDLVVDMLLVVDLVKVVAVEERLVDELEMVLDLVVDVSVVVRVVVSDMDVEVTEVLETVVDVVVKLVPVLEVLVGAAQTTVALPSHMGVSIVEQPVYSLQLRHPGSCAGQSSKGPLVAETCASLWLAACTVTSSGTVIFPEGESFKVSTTGLSSSSPEKYHDMP